MLLKIGICDDEPEYTTILADYLKTYDIDSEKDYSFQIDKFTSAKELLSAYTKPETYHILFLDVEMPEITVIELAKKIRMLGDKNVRIVFVSHYPEYMQESFNVQPFQFLTKPIDYASVSRLFSSIFKKFNRRSGNIVVIDSEREKNFVPINEILFITSMKQNKSRIRYQLTSNQLVSRSTLSDVEKQLTPYGFVSPSRGYLVNLRYIRTITSKCVILKNGLEIPISRRRASELQKTYAKYVVQML